MAELTTEQLDETRRIRAAADDYDNTDIHEARAVLTHRVPPLLDEIERLRAAADWLRSSMDFLMEIVDATQKKDQADRTALILRLARAEHAAWENQRLRAAVNEVRDLISESRGVAGLYLNGDVAEWPDLLPGGQYEDWLRTFGEVTAQEAGE